MDFFDFANLFGGLGLFLYGMHEMGASLENLSASKFENLLQKLTSNPLKSAFFGMIFTALIQSSSATTVIVVGLVNSSVMTLPSAIGVIMGANVGTTITSQILSLSGVKSNNFFVTLLKPKSFTPIIIIIGVLMLLVCSKNKHKIIGKTLVGFGILFTGMFTMESAVSVLKDSQMFKDLFTSLSNPILGVLAGAFVTAIIQSSSASVGILQALSSTGQIMYSSALPIIMGQNIGTCMTPLLSSIGASPNAKRSAIVHLYFNLIGTVTFLILIYSYQHFIGFSFWGDDINKSGIANFHTIFNVSITFLLLPFTKFLANLAEKTIKDNTSDEEISKVPILDERLLANPSASLHQVKVTLNYMSYAACKNVNTALDMVHNFDPKKIVKIKERENVINKLEVSLTNYLIKLTNKELTEEESKNVTSMMQLVIDFERIGDYANSLSKMCIERNDKDMNFTQKADKELKNLSDALREILFITDEAYKNEDIQRAKDIEPLEETIDLIKEKLRFLHMERLKSKECDIENGILYLEMISSMERTADHCSSIAFFIIAKDKKYDGFDRHMYKRALQNGKKEDFNIKYENFKQKYYNKINI